MKIIDLNGDGQDDLFIQNPYSVSIWDEDGQEIFLDAPGEYLVSTMGDADGDGVEDILAVYQIAGGKELVFVQKAQVAWRSPVQGIGYSSPDWSVALSWMELKSSWEILVEIYFP